MRMSASGAWENEGRREEGKKGEGKERKERKEAYITH
jgi:hypothetical protein